MQLGDSQVTARDRLTLEMRQYYPLPLDAKQEASFSFHAYFFFPRSFGVSPDKWQREEFYADSSASMRLHAPSLTLARLCNLEHDNNPATLLLDHLKDSLTRPTERQSFSTVAMAQMFGAELTDAIVAEAATISEQVERVARLDAKDKLEAMVRDFCQHSVTALRILRRVRAEASVIRGVAPAGLLSSLAFAEEYVSATLEHRLSLLGHRIENRDALRDHTGTALRLRLIIMQALESVASRSKVAGFARPMGGDAEYYTYRLGLLKKELQRALYVDTRQLQRDTPGNTAAMVAAGLAATWATLAQVPALSANLTSMQGVLLFAAAVGVYVTKDRLKEWLKSHLKRRWQLWDHDFKVLGNTLASVGMGEFTGRVRERVTWLREANLPDEVAKIRRHSRTVRGSRTDLEHILRYSRTLSLSTHGSAPLPQGYGLQEVLRLSVDEIVRRLDEPHEEVYLYDAVTGRFAHEALPRVYHLNLVIVTEHQPSGQVQRRRSRIVLNKQGIVRVEAV